MAGFVGKGQLLRLHGAEAGAAVLPQTAIQLADLPVVIALVVVVSRLQVQNDVLAGLRIVLTVLDVLVQSFGVIGGLLNF